MTIASPAPKKAYKSLPMEGRMAAWYARNTGQSLAEFERDADRIAARLNPGARILEAAPGPGYLAVALAKRGFVVTGLDISHAFVRIAEETAAKAGVAATFLLGDAAHIPLPADSFDFLVCRAAFKNFSDPNGAMADMRRVLKPGAEALIIDMNRNATNRAIDELVDEMRLGAIDALITRLVFKHSLRKRAYSRDDFQRMATAAGFADIKIVQAGIGFDVWLRK